MAFKRKGALPKQLDQVAQGFREINTILDQALEDIETGSEFSKYKTAVLQERVKELMRRMEACIIDVNVLAEYSEFDQSFPVIEGENIRETTEKEKYFLCQRTYLKKEGINLEAKFGKK